MVYKGKISAVMSDGNRATVTPYGGGIVTPELVVPVLLVGVLSVGDPVIYATFPDNTGIILQKADGTISPEMGGGGVDFITDETLSLDPETRVLSVNRADVVEQDNTLPITSAAVHTTVGNIETLLKLI